jgi:hypothetical protein
MTNQLPAPASRGKPPITNNRTTPQSVVPALIADAGEQAS